MDLTRCRRHETEAAIMAQGQVFKQHLECATNGCTCKLYVFVQTACDSCKPELVNMFEDMRHSAKYKAANEIERHALSCFKHSSEQRHRALKQAHSIATSHRALKQAQRNRVASEEQASIRACLVTIVASSPAPMSLSTLRPLKEVQGWPKQGGLAKEVQGR
jgi:hypothetical protein